MSATDFARRFLGTTRGQIVAFLRRGTRTVEELARAVGLTDNGVRNHLATLERHGIVRQEGVRRSPGAGKPAVLYEVHPDAEPLFSRAYAPVLTTTIDVLVDELSAAKAEELLREVGRRLGRDVGGQASGTIQERAAAAAAVLEALGGEVDVVHDEAGLRLRGYACPLSATVSRRPEMCRSVERLVGEVVGAPVRQCCEHGARPRCCFAVTTAA
ncbi:regulatory protein ArsR (plasmid) [Gemmatirosa kalamazoonensis]|uniref:Regulatory protein ArsR n=1 Tax=Gemmatirosa kalamazoonensis TaxID=861299 RepID=W0RSD6_9BACT|nr:helix-turn-helix domain-containing protein [Gemmatirosa kalamazoonensis]AHG93200.1 regulatory protein ArsR [Gemmatirosa kalamazoonensis]